MGTEVSAFSILSPLRPRFFGIFTGLDAVSGLEDAAVAWVVAVGALIGFIVMPRGWLVKGVNAVKTPSYF